MRYHEFLFLIFFCCKSFFIHASPEESDLYLDLLKEYYPYERPVEHSRDNVTVYVGLILQQIVDVDEKNQEVEVNAWLKMTWFDYRLRWDPSNYAGITEVRFRRNQIWTPDVLLYNSVAEEFDSLYSANVLVYSNGLATWIPPGF
uniref:Neurotransmitter-gated ion-channel ligand-binding domain-containing protein n=1 Tax=Panagrolaimus sp. PS1159 TaxID=55785 RepID=A0AC35FZ17_9BILA